MGNDTGQGGDYVAKQKCEPYVLCVLCVLTCILACVVAPDGQVSQWKSV